MTENEILEELDEIWTFGHEPTDRQREAINKAMDLIEKLEQYRSIGTVDEIRERTENLQRFYDKHIDDVTVDLPEYRKLCNLEEIDHMKTLKRIINRNGTIGKALDKCAEYEAIGTVSECREAVEKQRAKKPIMKPYFKDMEEKYLCCPTCGDILTDRIPSENKDFYFHCLNCGQAFLWESDNE